MRIAPLSLLLLALPAFADEGMWTFNRPPLAQMAKAYKFKPTEKWLEHVRLASVRFNSGGSGSFVSPNGLVLTNHHVGADCINKLGRKDANLIEDGFHALTQKDEPRCPDLELNVLVAITEVTKDVKSVEKPGMGAAEVNKAQKQKMTELEQKCATETGDRCDVVTLYQGAAFDLYRYHKYTDVRLVFAPEGQIAFFGGDADNFTYPRFDYDMALFRVYDKDAPLRPEHFLKWPKKPLKDGELVFTSGNPGNTSRLLTVAQLRTLRDLNLQYRLEDLQRMRKVLQEYMIRGEEYERQAHTPLFGVENGLKAITGYLAGLVDEQLMAKKAAEEAKVTSPGFAEIAKAQETYRTLFLPLYETENNNFGSKLFGIARGILRLVDEKQKPSDQRLREYRDSNLNSLELALFSPAPIYPELEIAQLASGLADFEKRLGAEDPLVFKVLAGKTPLSRAMELIAGSKLLDVAARRALAADPKALAASKDPLIELARMIDPTARQWRKKFEDEVEGPVKAAQTQIQAARNAKGALDTYPDATFTLRLSFGKVAGYEENGKKIPPWTTFGGLYAKSDAERNATPWFLPKKWVMARDKLKEKTPMNLATTNDIIGGNSGSPVINRAGELVGLIFDGNIQSLAGNFAYDERYNRAISVAAPALLEALEVVYGAGELVKELTASK
jgi:hypothetical protein